MRGKFQDVINKYKTNIDSANGLLLSGVDYYEQRQFGLDTKQIIIKEMKDVK